MKSRSRTIITRVIVFLLLGAIVNVAVAWAKCRNHKRVEHVQLLPYVQAIDRFDANDFRWDSFGFPIRSLTQNPVATNEATVAGNALSWNGGWRLDGPTWLTGIRPFAFPVRPLWPGFAINTIFYAAILALLFYGPGKVRRLVRVRGGRCPACGFIIAPGTCASGLCSECGATLPKRLLRPA